MKSEVISTMPLERSKIDQIIDCSFGVINQSHTNGNLHHRSLSSSTSNSSCLTSTMSEEATFLFKYCNEGSSQTTLAPQRSIMSHLTSVSSSENTLASQFKAVNRSIQMDAKNQILAKRVLYGENKQLERSKIDKLNSLIQAQREALERVAKMAEASDQILTRNRGSNSFMNASNVSAQQNEQTMKKTCYKYNKEKFDKYYSSTISKKNKMQTENSTNSAESSNNNEKYYSNNQRENISQKKHQLNQTATNIQNDSKQNEIILTTYQKILKTHAADSSFDSMKNQTIRPQKRRTISVKSSFEDTSLYGTALMRYNSRHNGIDDMRNQFYGYSNEFNQKKLQIQTQQFKLEQDAQYLTALSAMHKNLDTEKSQLHSQLSNHQEFVQLCNALKLQEKELTALKSEQQGVNGAIESALDELEYWEKKDHPALINLSLFEAQRQWDNTSNKK